MQILLKDLLKMFPRAKYASLEKILLNDMLFYILTVSITAPLKSEVITKRTLNQNYWGMNNLYYKHKMPDTASRKELGLAFKAILAKLRFRF